MSNELEVSPDRIAELEDKLAAALTKIVNIVVYLEQEAAHMERVHKDSSDRFDNWIANGKRSKRPEVIVALPVAAEIMLVAARGLRTTLYANGIKLR